MRRVEVFDVDCYVWENARFQFGNWINYNIIDFDQQMKWLRVYVVNWIELIDGCCFWNYFAA